MTPPLRGISSMATRSLLAALVTVYRGSAGAAVEFVAVGGIEVPRRLREGESFDIVVLAATALRALADEHLVIAASQMPFAISPAALAVRAGADKPAIGSGDELLRALRAATTIGYSTGPSGDALLRLLERAGILAEVRPRLLQAPPGCPVARLVAEGRAQIGLQQLSELEGVDGIEVVGTLPEGAQADTIFAAAICSSSRRAREAQAFLDFIGSPAAAKAIGNAFMSPYQKRGTAGATAT